MLFQCKYCGEWYEPSDYTDESEAAEDICPDCLYSGNMFRVEEDDMEEPDDDIYDEGDNDLDASYDDIDVSDEEFEEEL